ALARGFCVYVRTAEPVTFDEHAKAASAQLSSAVSREPSRFAALHRAVGDRSQNGGSWGKSDEEVLAAPRGWVALADGGAVSEATGARIRGPLREAEASQEETERAREQVDGLEEACRIRGGWRRG